MRFNVAAAALLGMVASAVADVTPGFDSIYKPAQDEELKVGSTVEIAWNLKPKDEAKYKNVKVNIDVLGGKDPNSLQVVGNIASGVDNADYTYSWKVASKMGSSTLGSEKQYGVRISLADDESVYQYSPRFTIAKAAGGDDDETSSSSSSGSATTSASESESSTSSKAAAKTSSAADQDKTSSAAATMETSSADQASTTMVVTTSAAQDATKTDSTAGVTGSPSSTGNPDSAGAQVRVGAAAALGGVAVALFAM